MYVSTYFCTAKHFILTTCHGSTLKFQLISKPSTHNYYFRCLGDFGCSPECYPPIFGVNCFTKISSPKILYRMVASNDEDKQQIYVATCTVNMKVDDKNHLCSVICILMQCNPVFNKIVNTVYAKTFMWENSHGYNAN